MKWKVNIILFSLLAGGGLAVLNLPANLTGPSSVKVVEFARPPDHYLRWTLLEKIAEGQVLLKNSAPLKFSEKEKKINYRRRTVVVKELLRQEIALAVLNRQSGEIFEKRFWLDNEEIKKANRLRRFYLENANDLPRFQPENIEEKLEVIVRWWNTFNSDLAIVDIAEVSGEANPLIVIGNKYLLTNDQLAYPEDQTGPVYSDVVYVPYVSEIHQPEIIKEGLDFLNQRVEMSFNHLRNLELASLAYADRLVAETIDPVFLKNLFLIEQIDPKMILLSEDGGRFLAERVLVRLGVNKEKTFRYTYSRTGALGLGQIMPGTYGAIVKKFPQAKLIKDVDVGRVDIQNSIAASLLVLDEHLAIVLRGLTKAQTRLLEKKIAVNPDFLNEIRAAIYNGGPKKYRPLTATISLAVSETVQFVKKYKMVRDLRLFD